MFVHMSNPWILTNSEMLKRWVIITQISLILIRILFNPRLKISSTNKLTTLLNKITNKLWINNKLINIKHLILNHRIKVFSNLIFKEQIIMKLISPSWQPRIRLRIDRTQTWTSIRYPKPNLKTPSHSLASNLMQVPLEKHHSINLACFHLSKPQNSITQIAIIKIMLQLLKTMMKDLKSLLIWLHNNQI